MNISICPICNENLTFNDTYVLHNRCNSCNLYFNKYTVFYNNFIFYFKTKSIVFNNQMVVENIDFKDSINNEVNKDIIIKFVDKIKNIDLFI